MNHAPRLWALYLNLKYIYLDLHFLNFRNSLKSIFGNIFARLLNYAFWDVQVWPYAAHQVETADWHTASSGSGESTSVLLGVSEHDLDGPAADPRIRNRRPEIDSSPVHVGVACCLWTVLGFNSEAVSD
jgi:hypothetical protein